MKKIAVIGSGTMGNGIAHAFAQYGYQVNLIDLNADALKNALATITKNLDRQIAKAVLDDVTKKNTLSNINIFTDLKIGIANADLIIEAATENTDIKLQLFKDLDQFAKPDAILASNTSSISITQLASATSRPEKVIGMHFMNPVPLMKLVEVIKGYATSEETTEAVLALAIKLDKTPVTVNDYPGFVANRILMPMINEAVYTLYEGVAGVAEIDTVMKLGMAHPMGPLQLADFIGLDVCLAILNVLYQGFGNSKYSPCPLLVNMVIAGKKGVKTGEGFYNYSNGVKEAVVATKFG
jgi:3-hydroxybutyryl-CoA dehydrogenase